MSFSLYCYVVADMCCLCVSYRHVYSVIVEAVYVDMDGTTSYMSPAVHCQVICCSYTLFA